MNDFDPGRYKDELIAIIDELDGRHRLDAVELSQVLRKHPKDGRGFFSKSNVIAGFRRFADSHDWVDTEQAFLDKLRMKPVRTQSGVTPVTVLTKPFPCPGKCIFCPSDLAMPKSYLSDEPGAQRATQNLFDPYLQTYNRLLAFELNGHSVDKVELLILGGTWSFYPESYQLWFVKRCFDAMNDYGDGRDLRDMATRTFDHSASATIDGSRVERTYNDLITRQLRERHGDIVNDWETATWQDLELVHEINESARCRSVGLVLETRPDHLTLEETVRLRRLGATKVQIGLQSLNDGVLELNKRGHTTAEARRAMQTLRRAGFKIQVHWMPNLHGSSVAADIQDFAQLFDDANYRPDELKIYPCSLIESAELMVHFMSGAWRPYAQDELIEVLAACLLRVPRYCRVNRVVRDIPSNDIVAGNKKTNFREVAVRELARRGQASSDIRAREIRATEYREDELKLRATCYETSTGEEQFLEFVTPDDRIVAFVRLSLPRRGACSREIETSALIRELHVYGKALALGHSAAGRPQHSGLGKQLMSEAARRASEAGYRDLAVISAIGTRPYYRKLGFVDGKLYQHLALEAAAHPSST